MDGEKLEDILFEWKDFDDMNGKFYAKKTDEICPRVVELKECLGFRTGEPLTCGNLFRLIPATRDIPCILGKHRMYSPIYTSEVNKHALNSSADFSVSSSNKHFSDTNLNKSFDVSPLDRRDSYSSKNFNVSTSRKTTSISELKNFETLNCETLEHLGVRNSKNDMSVSNLIKHFRTSNSSNELCVSNSTGDFSGSNWEKKFSANISNEEESIPNLNMDFGVNFSKKFGDLNLNKKDAELYKDLDVSSSEDEKENIIEIAF